MPTYTSYEDITITLPDGISYACPRCGTYKDLKGTALFDCTFDGQTVHIDPESIDHENDTPELGDSAVCPKCDYNESLDMFAVDRWEEVA